MSNERMTDSQIAFEAFRDGERGTFGITVSTTETEFETGPFTTFEELQDALHTLVDDTIKGQLQQCKRIGVHRIVLGAAPNYD